MNGKLGKKRLFISPIHVFWAIVFVGIFYAIIPALNISNQPVRVGQELLAKSASEAGSPNAVTAVVVWFRGLDTLGEVSVLFLVATALGMILGRARVVTSAETLPNEIVAHAKTLVLPHFMLTGLYITIHGHLSPGGGFPGGVMAASMALLLILAGDRVKQMHTLHFLEGFAGSLFALAAIAGIWFTGSFLGNLIPIKSEAFGTVFSAGIIPVLYIFIGIKVGTEIMTIYENFQRREEA